MWLFSPGSILFCHFADFFRYLCDSKLKKYKQNQQLNNFGETQQMSHCKQLWLRHLITVSKCDNVEAEI